MSQSAYPSGAVPSAGLLAADSLAVVLPYADALEQVSVDLVFVLEIDLVQIETVEAAESTVPDDETPSIVDQLGNQLTDETGDPIYYADAA